MSCRLVEGSSPGAGYCFATSSLRRISWVELAFAWNPTVRVYYWLRVV